MAMVPLLAELEARGLVHDATDLGALGDRLAEGPITLYYGCDPSADSLHVGNLIGLVVLRRFQLHGHHPIALAGGATGMIGDPGGRSSERNLLDIDTLAHNVAAIKEQIARVLGEEGDWTLVDNYGWSSELSVLDFLRDVGKHFTVNAMMAKESIRARLQGDEGISFTEFSYMLLQANDYLELHDRHGCELQIGGSDQWGNITAGVDLVRRRRQRAVHAFTWPLLTRSDGRKLGKSEGDAPWLGAHRMSPYRFYQYFMNVPDADVGRFLKVFTFVELDEIADLEAGTTADPAARRAQRRLAREVTALVHDPDAAAAAEEASAILFGGSPEEARAETLAALAGEVPSSRITREELADGVDVADLLAASGLEPSKSAARRKVAEGAASVNNRRVGADARVGPSDLLHGRYVLLRRGRKDYALVEVADRPC